MLVAFNRFRLWCGAFGLSGAEVAVFGRDRFDGRF